MRPFVGSECQDVVDQYLVVTLGYLNLDIGVNIIVHHVETTGTVVVEGGGGGGGGVRSLLMMMWVLGNSVRLDWITLFRDRRM